MARLLLRTGIWAALLLVLAGCAAGYSSLMRAPLKRLERRDYEGALVRLEKPEGKTNKLLYRLERGLIFHYQGQYAASNQEFEKAETLIDELYTRSVSRQLASLITNDAVIPYSGEEFERAYIHYYRALNYLSLGFPDDALVECRKANLRLADYAQAADYQLSYKNDAFIQYMTGLFYEAQGEWNDAYVSYQDAEQGYQAAQQAFGLQIPSTLPADLARLAGRLGFAEDRETYVERYHLKSQDLAQPGGGQVVVFVEQGFVARKRQHEIQVPLLKNDDTHEVWNLSDQLCYRYYHPHPFYGSVDYWLRVALPVYQPLPSQIQAARLSGGGRQAQGVLVADLDAIAIKTLQEKENSILAKTLARALSKYLLTKKVEKENEVLGVLFNWIGFATESADTRSWLSLPSRVSLVRFSLPPGTQDLTLELLDTRGQTVETQVFPAVQVAAGKTLFLNYRSFR
ncbi:MAG: hypothetical protein IT369_05450 [Candidatus Latescibacteria bacterium]|nr:hypothetical protein [Candidatus Latescibacterota bacterium]